MHREVRRPGPGVASGSALVLNESHGMPELFAVTTAAAGLGGHVRPDALVVPESTTCPGTTEHIFGPLIEAASGPTAGDDFALALIRTGSTPATRPSASTTHRKSWVARHPTEPLPHITDLDEAVIEADLVILVTAHDCFVDASALDKASAVLDTRGSLSGANVTRI